MKLNPKGVEKAEAAMALANPYSETYAEDRVIAALTAYFDHLREAGLMQEGRGWDHAASGYWAANTSGARMLPNDFTAIIIRQDEDRD